jgi:hypothetical protein
MKIIALRKGIFYSGKELLEKLKDRLYINPYYHKKDGYSLRIVR